MEKQLRPYADSDFEQQLNFAIECRDQGDFQQAESICLNLLERYPDDSQVLSILGDIARRVGSLEMAEFFLRRSVQVDRHNPESHFWLCSVLQDLEALEKAIVHGQQAVLLDPSQSRYYVELATALLKQERWVEAIANLHIAARLADPSSHLIDRINNKIHNALKQSGHQLQEALILAQEFAAREYALGSKLAIDQPQLAMQHFLKSLLYKPDQEYSYYVMGNLFISSSRLAESIHCFKNAVYWNPELVDAHHSLAILFARQGKWQEADSAYQTVFAALFPQDINSILPELTAYNLDFITSYAEFLVLTGQLEKAHSLIDPLVKAGNLHSGITAVFGLICSHRSEYEKAVDQLNQCLAQETLPDANRGYLLFSLGAFLHKQKSYDQAFQTIQSANTIIASAQKVAFDRSSHESGVSRIISVFSDDFFRALQSLVTAPQSELLIFIVGMPRSGTSLAEQILSCHPDVYAGGELRELQQLASELAMRSDPPQPYPLCMNYLTVQQKEPIAQEYLGKIQDLDPRAKRITDKLPANFAHLGLIATLFPQAKIIHCNRHPLDTCLSCYFTSLDTSHPYSFDLEDLGFYYVQYRRLMNHWSEVLPIKIFDLHYEDLVLSPEATVRALLHYCGLPWHQDCLNFHQSKRSVATASNQQVRQPLYQTSIQRYRLYEKYLEPLKQMLER